jgi:hypothetical protein
MCTLVTRKAENFRTLTGVGRCNITPTHSVDYSNARTRTCTKPNGTPSFKVNNVSVISLQQGV